MFISSLFSSLVSTLSTYRGHFILLSRFGLFLLLTFSSLQSYASPDLEALLKQAQKKKAAQQKKEAQKDLAQVTFLLFLNQVQSPKKLIELQRLFQQELMASLNPKQASRFVLNQILRKDMPISVDPLIQLAPQHKEVYQSAPVVLSFFYRGPRLKRDQHLSSLCTAIDQVWDRVGEGVLANLSTFYGDTPISFAKRCRQFNLGWVRPEAEVTEKGEIRVLSRGLDQFAQPDLESTPLSKSDAPYIFPQFQRDMNTILRGTPIKEGSLFQGKKVLKCLRENHLYDRKCVRLTYSK